jgi:hypothetical protein
MQPNGCNPNTTLVQNVKDTFSGVSRWVTLILRRRSLLILRLASHNFLQFGTPSNILKLLFWNTVDPSLNQGVIDVFLFNFVAISF